MKIRTSIRAKACRLTDHVIGHATANQRCIPEWIQWKRFSFQRDRMERELFQSCVLLKNIAVVHQKMPVSADFILEQLMESSQGLKFIYADILSAYRTGSQEEAFRGMYKKLPMNSCQKFIRILQRLDSMNPADLIVQMNAFEETLTAERKTKAMARAERRSLATTLASTATIFVVLLNFVVVVVFLDTMQTLSRLYT